ncbi:type I polyketide synthase, partial [Jidongwangia harbinensis]|uniref:type I polyketide synthase n=1 Tax=Jidongwangia harbinensis TaxID=2878561 RepID=UPI001CD9EF12
FAGVVEGLAAQGASLFVECSPHPVLVPVIEAAAVGSLRRDDGGPRRMLRSLADAFELGAPVRLAEPGTPPPALPTYPFQRQRYWVAPQRRDTGVSGFAAVGHPLLSGVAEVGDTGQLLLTGRLDAQAQSWLAEHIVGDTVVVPGTVALEVALAAAEQAGCDTVAELTVTAPMVLTDGRLDLQITVGSPGGQGERTVAVHAREADGAWRRHAEGVLAVSGAAPGAPAAALAAPAIDLGDAYERMAALGVTFGDAYRGLRAVRRLGDVIEADVAVPDDADAFHLHPVLLATAMQADLLCQAGDEMRMPFSWTGVRVRGGPATPTVRVRTDGATRTVHDATGAPIAHVAGVVLRPVAPGGFDDPDAAVFRLDWPVLDAPPAPPGDWAVLGGDLPGASAHADLAALGAALDAGAAVPEVVFHLLADASATPDDDLPAATRAATAATLELIRAWLAEPRLAAARLVAVTRGAVPVRPGEPVADLVHAPVWGLIRVAGQEHPGQFGLLDLDGPAPDPATLAAALATGEPQLAMRAGSPHVPRIVPAPPAAGEPIDTSGTVLVTGATGGLGALVARHLAERHEARNLLLVSRSGSAADGATELVADLAALGVAVTVAAVDVADRDDLARVLANLAPDRPLSAVVHVAAVLDDGVLTGLTADQIDRVFRPKVDALLHLDALTRDLPVGSFVLFSSIASRLAGHGSGSYSAANAFVDAFAARRHADGRPVVSLAWGLWAESGGMAGRLNRTGLAGIASAGLTPMDAAEALRLLDAAATAATDPTADALLLPLRLERALMRAAAARGELPATLDRLVRVPRRTAGAADAGGAETLVRRLAAAGPGERQRILTELVRTQVAAVLGYGRPADVDPDRAFRELGFDSVSALHLRNRLNAATGLRLPTTVVFDSPTVTAIAERVAGDLVPTGSATRDEAAPDDDQVRRILAAVDLGRLREAGLLDALLRLGAEPDAPPAESGGADAADDLDDLDLERLVQLALDPTEH